MLNVVYTINLSLCMLSVVMQNVIMLSVMAPIDKEQNKTKCFFYQNCPLLNVLFESSLKIQILLQGSVTAISMVI
jgi:hypothetical protein